MQLNSEICVRPVRGRRDVRDWLSVQPRVFQDDPAWIQPLNIAERERIDRKCNPFFLFGDAELFVAYRGDTPVGRISAQINHRHLAQHHDGTGHFGFFDCINDQAVAARLFAAASEWLRACGLSRMAGPFSFSINEDLGLLVEGAETAPAFMCSHAPPYLGGLVEGCGLTKAVDLLAYRLNPQSMSSEFDRLCRLARAASGVTIRHLNLSDFRSELGILFDIYNDGWSDNWGFVPFSQAEIDKLTADMKPIIQPKFGRVVELNNEPIAMIAVLPNVNEVIAPFDGRLIPFNWARLLWAIKKDDWKTARIALLGVRRKFNATPLATAILSLLAAEMIEMSRREYNLDWIELSWILETNKPMVKVAEFAAGKPCRRYRIYETAI